MVSVHRLAIPKKAQEKFLQGVRRLHKRELAASLRDFAAAIALYPDYYEAYYHRGIAQTILKQNDQALDSFQQAIDKSEGRYPQAEFGYGLVLCRQGRAAEAEPIIHHGLASAPYLSDGYVILAVAMLKQKKLAEAERLARESLAMSDQGEGKGYLLLADVAAEQRNYRLQARNLAAYLDLHPGDPDQELLRATRDAAQKVADNLQQAAQ